MHTIVSVLLLSLLSISLPDVTLRSLLTAFRPTLLLPRLIV